jgi:hypothetical protein
LAQQIRDSIVNPNSNEEVVGADLNLAVEAEAEADKQ